MNVCLINGVVLAMIGIVVTVLAIVHGYILVQLLRLGPKLELGDE